MPLDIDFVSNFLGSDHILHPLFNNAFLFAKEVIVGFAANVFVAKAVKVGKYQRCCIVFAAAPILYLYAVANHLALSLIHI